MNKEKFNQNQTIKINKLVFELNKKYLKSIKSSKRKQEKI